MATGYKDKKTPVFDWQKGDFKRSLNGAVATVTGSEAVEQVIIKAQQTARGVFAIYADIENAVKHHKYGNDTPHILAQSDISDDVRDSELKRAVREALIYDPWITDVYDIVLSRETDPDTNEIRKLADFKVMTVFSKEIHVGGVSLDG